jgi:hypothetical protein
VIAWAVAVLPPLYVFALGMGMSGRMWTQLPGDIVRKALELDVFALWIVIASLPLALLPYWLWTAIRSRS